MFMTPCCVVRVARIGPSLSRRRRWFSTDVTRNYMSTQTSLAPEEEPRMMLILGKPGGGKGTISNKVLKVGQSRVYVLCRTCRLERFFYCFEYHL